MKFCSHIARTIDCTRSHFSFRVFFISRSVVMQDDVTMKLWIRFCVEWKMNQNDDDPLKLIQKCCVNDKYDRHSTWRSCLVCVDAIEWSVMRRDTSSYCTPKHHSFVHIIRFLSCPNEDAKTLQSAHVTSRCMHRRIERGTSIYFFSRHMLQMRLYEIIRLIAIVDRFLRFHHSHS